VPAGPGADDPAITTVPTLPGNLHRADVPGGPAHQESEEPTPPMTSAPANGPSTPAAMLAPATVPSAEPVGSAARDGLPPLPADLGRNPDAGVPSNLAAESSSMTPGGSSPRHAEDEPLTVPPSGTAAPSIPAAAPALGLGAADPAPTATAPLVGSAPAPSQGETAPAMPGAGASLRAVDEDAAGSAARRSAGPQAGPADPASGDPRDGAAAGGTHSTPT